MFGDRMVLMQTEDGASGGGDAPAKPILQRIFPRSMDNLVVDAPGNVESGFATEADDIAPAEYDPTRGGGEKQGAGRGGERVGGPAAGKFLDPIAKKQPTGFAMKGQITTPRTPEEAEAYQQAQLNIFESEQRKAIAEGEAMGLAESVLSDYANVAQYDALEGRRLHNEYFAPAKRKLAALYQAVDDARSMKVNPFNWHESIGRGGRVAAAFSVFTGQIAAGAGNPNSALAMMDAAIERDISAQEQNIKNEYENLKLQRGLQADELGLFQEEIASINQTRAVYFAGMQAKIAAAKQRAINVAHAETYQVAHDHYNMKLLDAINAGRNQIHIEVNKAVSAATIKSAQAQVEQIQSAMKPGTLVQGPGEAAPTATAEGSVKAAPGRAGAVGGRRGSQAKTGTTPPQRGEASEGTPSAEPLDAPTSGAGIPQQVERDGMSMMETQEEADERYAKQYDEAVRAQGATNREAAKATRDRIASSPVRTLRGIGEKHSAGGGVDENEMWAQLTKDHRDGGASIPKRVAEAGGYGLATSIDPVSGTGEGSLGITSVYDGVSAVLANKTIPNGGMLLNRDADILKAIVPKPKRNQFKHEDQYTRAVNHWQRGQDYSEIYEGRSKVAGERNTIVAGGMAYRLSDLSEARTDAKAYGEIQSKIAQQVTGQKGIMKLAKQIRTHGLQGMFTPEGGINIPGLNTSDPATMLMVNKMITNAMTYIKTHDPTARISDKDLEVGMEAMGDFMTTGGKLLDFFQTVLDGDSQNNTKRIQIERFFATIAIASQEMLWDEFEDDMVPTYNTMVKADEEALKLRKFIDLKREN